MGAAEIYAKGQVFARVGRMSDAREMLALGDRTGASGYDVRQRFSDSRGSQHASESALDAAREALVRDLADRREVTHGSKSGSCRSRSSTASGHARSRAIHSSGSPWWRAPVSKRPR